MFFTLYPLSENIVVHQFDIKGDKDKQYEMNINEFDKYWEILSYSGKATKPFERFERLINIDKLYHVTPFRGVDYIITTYKNKKVRYHK